MQNHKLSQELTSKKIILFAIPTIFTMIFMALYMIIDGMFVAHYLDEYAFSSLNVVYPFISMVIAVGLMLATGSSAVIGKLLGEGNEEKARQFFTQIYMIGIFFGLIASIIALLFMEDLLFLLQAKNELYKDSKEYFLYYTPFFIPVVLHVFTQSFFVTSGKPALGATACFFGGIANIIFDYVFIGLMDLGVKGASLATGIGLCIPSIFSLVYFGFSRQSLLHFVPVKAIDWRNLLQSCSNGLSEFVNHSAMAITTLLFNLILFEMEGEVGVAAITTILYIQIFQIAVYVGYSMGVAPLISYKYGEKNRAQLKKISQTSFWVVALSSIAVVIFSLIFGDVTVAFFIPRHSETFHMAKEGLEIFSLAYLFMGANIYTSALFTALSNGKVSAIVSCSRTLVFFVANLLILPIFFGLTGVWVAVPLAEMLSFFISFYYLKKLRKNYGY